MNKLVFKSKKVRQAIRILAFGTGFIVMLSAVFFTLFRIFERITYDSISDLNRDFAIQIDTLTETINSSIVNYGMQLFYSNAVKTMMGAASFSNTDRVYMTRDLNTSLSFTEFAGSIIIHNGYTNRVYSTDPSFPDQSIDTYRNAQIRELLTNRTNENRFKPIYCHEEEPESREFYTFMFYEINPDGSPKPSTLIITVKSEWYKRALLASNPASDLIVINKRGGVLVSASDSLLEKYLDYYPFITVEKNSGYFINKQKKEICMYYESLTTGHTYMKISSLSKALPRLLYFRQIVVYFMVTLISVFGCALLVLLIYALMPMLKMKDAITTINKFLEGDEADIPDTPPLPLKEQIDAVVSKSERTSLEQIFYDMLAGKLSLSSARLFKDMEGPFGLMLIHALHRKDIYGLVEKQHPELVVTKSSHIYACIGIYRSKEDYHGLALCLSGTLDCRLFQSVLFTDFDSLPLHFSNLHELRRLSLVLGPEERLIPEEALFSKALANTVTTRDFTDLIVRLKSGSLDLSRAKWQEIRSTIVNYRYDDFQYVLNRAEDTICSILNEFSSDLLKDSQKLLPESLEQIKDLDVIDQAFDRAFVAICGNYSEKKAEKYSELAKQIKGIVQENYHDSSLNSQRIADMIQMNNAYLGRMFKNSYGRSINDYINTCRLEESMRLLRQTDMSVEEIAQNVGFSNIKYFYVLFKKLTGITPATYRAG